MSPPDVLSHFGALDELIQVVYQGIERFVVMSTVTESSWAVHVGLKGSEGRWWRGSWTACDVTTFIGASEPDSKVLEGFAHNLYEAFVSGEIHVGDWAPDHDANINLTFRPASKKPVHIPLVELSAKEAASHATAIFSGIALQAQSRKCRLYPTHAGSFGGAATLAEPSSRPRADSRPKEAQGHGSSVPSSSAAPRSRSRSRATKAELGLELEPEHGEDEAEIARRKIKSLEVELEHVKKAKAKTKHAKSTSPPSEPNGSVVQARKPKGASLANPHKKARKYEEMEFESD